MKKSMNFFIHIDRLSRAIKGFRLIMHYVRKQISTFLHFVSNKTCLAGAAGEVEVKS